MPDWVMMVLAGFAGLIWGLSTLARRLPHIMWLQAFRDAFPRPTEEQKAEMRRRADINAGVHFILLGISLPLIFGAMTVMFFNDFTKRGVALVLAASVLCIGLGIVAICRTIRR